MYMAECKGCDGEGFEVIQRNDSPACAACCGMGQINARNEPLVHLPELGLHLGPNYLRPLLIQPHLSIAGAESCLYFRAGQVKGVLAGRHR